MNAETSTIVITGATGDAGSWVLDHLADAGHRVVGVDRERPAGDRPNAEFRAVDLTDQGEAWEVVHEADPDVVVHLAALPNPLDDPGTRVFENNTMGTYNTLVAAGRADATIVWTSSQSVYGALYARETWLPDYLPMDEDHERRPEDAYGASKVCGEEIAATVSRRYGVPVTSIRPATIGYPGGEVTRGERKDFDLENAELSGDFWSYVDVRDLARLIELAIEPPYDGHETFLAAADENYLGHPTAEVIEAAAGRLPERCDLEGKQAALSNAKAEELLGWRPERAWHEAEDETAASPDWL